MRENESSQNLAKSATAVPGAVEGKTVEKKKPSAHRAKGQQGQKNISATQEREGRNRVLTIPVIAQGKLLRRFPGTSTINKLCSQNHKKHLNPGAPVPCPVWTRASPCWSKVQQDPAGHKSSKQQISASPKREWGLSQ